MCLTAACQSCFCALITDAAKLVSAPQRPTSPVLRCDDHLLRAKSIFAGTACLEEIHLSALRTTPVRSCAFPGIGSTADTAARPRQPAARCTKSSGARGMACTDSEAYEDKQAYARSAISRACAGGEQHHETARLCVLPDRWRPHAEDTARPPLPRSLRSRPAVSQDASACGMCSLEHRH
jgi:hypothetical protein